MPKLLEEIHPELVHYTSAAGLLGIVQSQTLRATHYAYLNDAEEVRHFLKSRLPEIAELAVASYLDDLVKQNANYRRRIDQDGGRDRIIEHKAREVAGAMENRLLGNRDGWEALAEPYVTSFCTARDDDERVRRHGLLSQWRGYGRDGGYAIVFETAGLSALLGEAWNGRENDVDLFGGDVIYSSDPDQKFHDEFGADLDVVRKFFSDQFKGVDDSPHREKIFISMMRCACRYKHWGFKEENEVRIILIPNNKEVCERARKEGITVNEIPRKHDLRAGALVPFIELLERVTSPGMKPLPIKRIIVGPAPNEQERTRRIRAVEILLGQYGMKALVTASEIPYLG